MSSTSNITETLSRDFARKWENFYCEVLFPSQHFFKRSVFLRIPRESLLSSTDVAVVPTDVGGVKKREVAVYGRHSDDQQGNLRRLQRGKGLRLFPSSGEERERVGIPTHLRALQDRADPGGQGCPQVRPFLPDRSFPKGSRTAKRLVAQSRLRAGALCQRLPRAAEST
ncbi:MAG: hypothetical protein FJZ04_02230 [Candidatus Moranbacteria bacterium]|nr:hypothetical protein [Candidatus Moranbacteria bacterium]